MEVSTGKSLKFRSNTVWRALEYSGRFYRMVGRFIRACRPQAWVIANGSYGEHAGMDGVAPQNGTKKGHTRCDNRQSACVRIVSRRGKGQFLSGIGLVTNDRTDWAAYGCVSIPCGKRYLLIFGPVKSLAILYAGYGDLGAYTDGEGNHREIPCFPIPYIYGTNKLS